MARRATAQVDVTARATADGSPPLDEPSTPRAPPPPSEAPASARGTALRSALLASASAPHSRLVEEHPTATAIDVARATNGLRAVTVMESPRLCLPNYRACDFALGWPPRQDARRAQHAAPASAASTHHSTSHALSATYGNGRSRHHLAPWRTRHDDPEDASISCSKAPP